MIAGNVLNNAIFEPGNILSTSTSNFEEKLKNVGATYPPAITIPDMPPIYVVSWYPQTGFTATGIDGSWNSLTELYDHIHLSFNAGVTFDESVFKAPHIEENILGVIDNNPESNHGDGNRMLTSLRNERNYVFARYYRFLRLAREWMDDQENFHKAFTFLQLHPIFWSKADKGDQHFRDDVAHHVAIHVAPVYDANGNTVVRFEAGQAMAPRFTSYYSDPRLLVFAETFEQGYVELARKVHQHFTLDGEDRRVSSVPIS